MRTATWQQVVFITLRNYFTHSIYRINTIAFLFFLHKNLYNLNSQEIDDLCFLYSKSPAKPCNISAYLYIINLRF